MSKIDHADDPVHHGVADGDQAIDRAEHNAVDQLLGEIIHTLPLFEHFPAWHFLTVGTRCGNSARCGLKGLYIASFKSRGSVRHSRDKPSSRNDPSGTAISLKPTPGFSIVSGYVQPGRSRCLTRTRIRASRTRTRARSPANSKVAARSP